MYLQCNPFTVLLLACNFSGLGILQVFRSDLINISLFGHISKSKENSFNSVQFLVKKVKKNPSIVYFQELYFMLLFILLQAQVPL